jgi:hypothetical protein
MASKAFTETYIQLPEDDAVLRDLYLKATYYRIPELQAALYEKTWFVKVKSMFSGGKNPYVMATRWLAWLRGALIAFGSLGTIGGTVLMSMKHDMETALQAVGIQDAPAEENKGLLDSTLHQVGLRRHTDARGEQSPCQSQSLAHTVLATTNPDL